MLCQQLPRAQTSARSSGGSRAETSDPGAGCRALANTAGRLETRVPRHEPHCPPLAWPSGAGLSPAAHGGIAPAPGSTKQPELAAPNHALEAGSAPLQLQRHCATGQTWIMRKSRGGGSKVKKALSSQGEGRAVPHVSPELGSDGNPPPPQLSCHRREHRGRVRPEGPNPPSSCLRTLAPALLAPGETREEEPDFCCVPGGGQG